MELVGKIIGWFLLPGLALAFIFIRRWYLKNVAPRWEAQTRIYLANHLADRGREDEPWLLEHAVGEYLQALMLDRNNYDGHAGLARTHSYIASWFDGSCPQSKKWQKWGWSASSCRARAVEECREAIRLDSERFEAYSTLAYCLELEGHLSAAVVEYRETIRLTAAHAARLSKEYLSYPHQRLGLVLRKLGQHEEALAEFAWARRLCPDWNPPPE